MIDIILSNSQDFGILWLSYILKQFHHFLIYKDINIFKIFLLKKKIMHHFNKYPFLADLGLSHENFGASLGGKWVGDGEWVDSYNPNNGEVIARIKLGTI